MEKKHEACFLFTMEVINLYPTELVKWTCPPSIFGTSHYQFLGCSWHLYENNLVLNNGCCIGQPEHPSSLTRLYTVG